MAPLTPAKTIDYRSHVSSGAESNPTTGPHEESGVAQPAASAGRGVLEDAFAVLEALAQADGGLGLAELASASGLAKTSAYRLAERLIALGAVQRMERRYFIGARVGCIGLTRTLKPITESRDDVDAQCSPSDRQCERLAAERNELQDRVGELLVCVDELKAERDELMEGLQLVNNKLSTAISRASHP
jgi:hypothetical protein